APPAREPAPAAGPHAEVAPFDLMDDEEHGTLGSEGLLPPASTSFDPPVSEGPPLDLPGGVAPIRPEDVEGIALPRPPASWEAGFEDEGPTDSDGTWTRGETSAAGAWLEAAEQAAEADEDPLVEAAAGALEVEVTEEAAEAEDEAEEETEEETEEEELTFAEEASSDDEVDEEEPEEPEEEEGEGGVEYEYVDEDGNPIDISSLEDGDYELVDEDEYEEVEEEDDAEYEEADEEEAAEYEEEEEDDGPDASFDDGEEYEEADEDEEPMVLEPQSPPPLAPSQSERLLTAGRVLVRQGRVAVSVLQQELDMEFDEACELLDQLQAEGLIGPYKGGKKRDILLSEEEWEDHFARS
ncbi:MAG: DNA translocase FtsK, partial [Planctomycetota bacterium]